MPRRYVTRPSYFHSFGILGIALLLLSVNWSSRFERAEGSEFPKPYNTQPETITLLKPDEALKRIHLPSGFQATLFAGEPDVQQPIGITTDARGRLWVAENYTYAEGAVNFAKDLRDRVVILEDTDGDGKFDKRKVFWDEGKKLTSVAVGFGGVFVLCPPQLLFIPDRNGDDIPDSAPEVLLDGWDDGVVRHNIANGLKWGPDGWLYGRHGIQATSMVGKPGTPKDQRVMVNCSIWRYHPVTHAFEVVARGTTNPWGHDWDDYGELFFINTVIGHLWHVLPGAYYKRMYGEHADPYLYELMDQTADHLHWDAKETWLDVRKGVTATTSQAGGGHAHSGLMIYLGDNWPAEYRGTIFTVNYHGRRLNNDRLERNGAGYVGRHGADFMTTDDPWFRGIDLLYGPDGGVYVADWSDIGECHEQDGVHRTSGRIYKITYGQPKLSGIADLSKLSDAELVKLQLHENDWFVRQARQIMQERAVRGSDMKTVHNALQSMFQSKADPRHKLRAMWALYVTGGADENWLRQQLRHNDEHIRVWAIRLLLDQKTPSNELIVEFTRMAQQEQSGLVLSYLASALQRIPLAERWSLAEGLASHAEFANDPHYPLMVWYGIEPAVPQDQVKAVTLADKSKLPKVRKLIARRITEDLDVNPESVGRLMELFPTLPGPEAQRDVLKGMSEALRGWSKATPPPAWAKVSPALLQSSDSEVSKTAKEVAVVFGDGRATEQLREIVANKNNDLNMRRRALQTLVQSHAPNLLSLLRSLFPEMEISPDAVRGLGTLGYPETPSVLLKEYPSLRYAARIEAINSLSSRPAFAITLLNAVQTNLISRNDVGAFQLRQMRSFNQPEITEKINALWPGFQGLSAEKQQQLTRYQRLLTPERLASASLSNGRELFNQSCGTCHTLFGQGGKIGPDLTGSDRANLGYLLDNILDPSGIVPADYRVSVVTLKDGRVINGVLSGRNERRVRIQTPTEQLTVERGEIESITDSQLSMMPEGLLESLSEDQTRDLIAYLMSQQQVPLKEN